VYGAKPGLIIVKMRRSHGQLPPCEDGVGEQHPKLVLSLLREHDRLRREGEFNLIERSTRIRTMRWHGTT
jgi:hypothetical protein